MGIMESASGSEVGRESTTVPVREFHKAARPYLRLPPPAWGAGIYTMFQLMPGFSAADQSARSISGMYDRIYYSSTIRPITINVNETAAFGVGVRALLARHGWLELGYLVNSFAIEEETRLALVTNIYPEERQYIKTALSTSAFVGNLCYTGTIYGTLKGYAGVGAEYYLLDYFFTDSVRQEFSGSTDKVVTCEYILGFKDRTRAGALLGGGSLSDRALLPHLHFGAEWRPNRVGFAAYADYRLSRGNFQTVQMGIEQTFFKGDSSGQVLSTQTISYTTIDLLRLRLPAYTFGGSISYSF
jgi:hypothetical protein